VTAESGRTTPGNHFDHPAQRVAGLLAGIDLGLHGCAGIGIEAAHRIGIDRRKIGHGREAVAGRGDAAELHDMAEHGDPTGLGKEILGDPSDRHPGGGLPGAGSFQHWTRLGEVVFLHASQVGVARTRSGQRRIAGQLGEQYGIDRVGGHHLVPLGPFGVADHDRDRRAQRLAVPHTGEDGQLVGLEPHPGTAARTQPAPGERFGDVLGGDPDSGWYALDRRNQGASM